MIIQVVCGLQNKIDLPIANSGKYTLLKTMKIPNWWETG